MAVGITSPAVAADQFDLVCSAPKASARYRIDLARGEYCADECGAVLKIASVTAGDLTLADDKPAIRNGIERFERISRSTGKWYSYSFSPQLDRTPSVRRGECTLATFTGFPTAKF